MIVGVGVDIVDLARFARALERAPRLRARLFTPEEHTLPPRSLAANFAAKEAFIKALRGPQGLSWQDVTVRRVSTGAPEIIPSPLAVARMNEQGIARCHLSLSHDANAAIAFVVAEGDTP